uniref:CCDC22 coiled-coil domain-containing protein n=1 Tax=Amphimedon queenslandica TaxID=400682 RepID=A0A1X7SEA8_AMPQE
ILTDTKYVQKEINQLSGKLDRVFQDARKDEARRSTYKLLASIRDNSKQVVEAIHEAGQVKREQCDPWCDLEEQV